MPVQLEANIEGEQQLSRRLMIVAKDIDNFKPPLEKIGSELRRVIDLNFTSRGSLFGGWKPRLKAYPWPILEKTGSMRRSFKQKLGGNFVEIYNTADYFKYHQSRKSRSTRLPRRVMMKLDQQRKEFVQKAFQAYIVDIIRKSKSGL